MPCIFCKELLRWANVKFLKYLQGSGLLTLSMVHSTIQAKLLRQIFVFNFSFAHGSKPQT